MKEMKKTNTTYREMNSFNITGVVSQLLEI